MWPRSQTVRLTASAMSRAAPSTAPASRRHPRQSTTAAATAAPAGHLRYGSYPGHDSAAHGFLPGRAAPGTTAPDLRRLHRLWPGARQARRRPRAAQSLEPAARYHRDDTIAAEQRPVVFIGPFEHHSNELPWRESLADVVVIPQDGDGHIDAAAPERELLGVGRPTASHRGIAMAPCPSGTLPRPPPPSTSRCMPCPSATCCPSRTPSSSARTS